MPLLSIFNKLTGGYVPARFDKYRKVSTVSGNIGRIAFSQQQPGFYQIAWFLTILLPGKTPTKFSSIDVVLTGGYADAVILILSGCQKIGQYLPKATPY